MTLGFGGKWKIFFQALELSDGLNPDFDSHIWLLHLLFLEPINLDAMDWAQAWNNHIIGQQGGRHASPRDRFFFGMLENGFRGFEAADEEVADAESYGIDWDDYEDPQIQAHHHSENPIPAHANHNPFVTQMPTHLNHVEVEIPNCPLNDAQLGYLQQELQALPFSGSRNMDDYRLLWITALHICEHVSSNL